MTSGIPVTEPISSPASRVSSVQLLESIGSDVYRVASMLLGDGENSIRLTEQVVLGLDPSSIEDEGEARHRARLALAADAIALAAEQAPESFAAIESNSGPVSCIEDDDLDAAGVSQSELEQMLTGSQNHHLRTWLEGLPEALRFIFVLRAVAGFSTVEVAVLLAENGGEAAQEWSPDAVRSTYRQGLCSLASQLLQASTAH